MRRNAFDARPSASGRSAFTLVELMVVIAIIAALIALTAGGVMKYIGSQMRANTQGTLDKTQSQLNKAWSKVKDQAYSEKIDPVVEAWIQANLSGTDANSPGRTRVLYVKLKLRQVFPMNFNEAINPAPLPPLPAYKTYLNQLGITASTGAPYESSACVLMALQRGVSGAGVEPSDLTAGGALAVVPTPKGTLNYLADAWGQPLYFTRVPVGSAALNSNPFPGGGQVGNNDLLDPQGYLQTGGWAKAHGALFQKLTLQQLAGPNMSYKQAPMLCSSGPDKQLQTDPITFVTVPGGDDLFSTP
jgi:prepilin-type N-terminal cleavage/methylation domain-containing protein